MPAVVTDKFRIDNASNFIDSVNSNNYYVFAGLPNPTAVPPQAGSNTGFGRNSAWNDNNGEGTPDPTDNLEYLTNYRDSMMFGKKITSSNIRRVVKKYEWVKNNRFDMYRHDYSDTNLSPISDALLYTSNYYVINSDFRVYICIDNGSSGKKGLATPGTNPTGNASLYEPTFTDLEPSTAAPAGSTSDGYVWKYLFTVSPSDIIKFDSTEYIVLPNDWSTSTDSQIESVRESSNSDTNKNQIKKVYIKNPGSPSSTAQYETGEYVVDILGDGTGGRVLVTVDGKGRISDTKVVAGGSGYTYGIVDLSTVRIGTEENSSISAELIPIIPPSKGHGYDIYEELGADKVLIYTRFDSSDPDFSTDTKFSQIGIIKNPKEFNSENNFNKNSFSSLFSIKLEEDVDGNGPLNDSNTIEYVGNVIKQTIPSDKGGGTARGYVASYNASTKVLKYFQDRSLHFGNGVDHLDSINTVQYGKVSNFYTKTNSDDNSPNSITITTGSVDNNITIDTTFGSSGGATAYTTSSGGIIELGSNFIFGLSNPEINKKTGDIIYIDNRQEVERDLRQKEDIKIVLEF
tara:strand:+ start:15450 stop:17165 length:1716 start_codon:yes stop_codon:yes gene_type:complete